MFRLSQNWPRKFHEAEAVRSLRFGAGQIRELTGIGAFMNLGENTSLTAMISCGNRLHALDIPRSTSLARIGIDNMHMFTGVRVWTLPFPPPGVEVLMEFSPALLSLIHI